MSLSGGDETPLGNEVLSKKKRSRAAYKGQLSKLEKDIKTFLNEFVPGNLLHISKLKSYKNNVAEKNEQIKQLNNEILELVQVEELGKETNIVFSLMMKSTVWYQGLRLESLYYLQLIQQIPMLVT